MATVKKTTKKKTAVKKKAVRAAETKQPVLATAPEPEPMPVAQAAGAQPAGKAKALPGWVIPAVVGVIALLTVLEMAVMMKSKADLNRRLEQVAEFGERGGVPRPEAYFGAVALKSDSVDRLFLVDSDWNKIVVYDAKSGKFLLALNGKDGKDVGHEYTPVDAAGDGQGMIYVLDRVRQLVLVFSPEGAFVREWPAPSGIALTVNPRGEVLITDNARMQIVYYSPEGKELRRIGSPGSGKGQLNNPSRIATDKQGRVYAVDLGNKRLEVFNPQGGYHNAWPFKFEPTVLLGVSISKNEIYLNDFGGSYVWTYSLDGKLTGRAAITCPSNLAVDNEGNIYLPTISGLGRYVQVSAGAK